MQLEPSTISIVIVILYCLTWCLALYKAEIAQKSHPPLGDIVNIDGKIAHVMIMGTGEDLVLIHGSSGNIRDFTLSIAPSLAKDFRVIMIDRPGLGYSKSFNKSGETLKEQAIFLYQVAKTFGANKPIVLGHSLGGAVALAWAVYLPNNISGLLPLSAVSNRWPGGTSAFYNINKNFILNKFSVPIISAFAPKRKIESDVKEVFNPQEVPSNFLKEFGVELTLRPKTIVANAKHRNQLKEQIIHQSEFYSNISVPTIIMHGIEDGLVPISVHAIPLAKQIPNSKFIKFSGIGHMPHHFRQNDIVYALNQIKRQASNTQK